MSAPVLSGLEEEALGKAYDGRLLRRLWHYVSPYTWQVVLTIAIVGPAFVLEIAPISRHTR